MANPERHQLASKSVLFEIVLTLSSMIALYESWNYLNGANAGNYSQVITTGFMFLMLSGAGFAIGFIYLLADLQKFVGRRSG